MLVRGGNDFKNLQLHIKLIMAKLYNITIEWETSIGTNVRRKMNAGKINVCMCLNFVGGLDQ